MCTFARKCAYDWLLMVIYNYLFNFMGCDLHKIKETTNEKNKFKKSVVSL